MSTRIEESEDGSDRTAKRLKLSSSGQVTSEEGKKPAEDGFVVQCKGDKEFKVSLTQSILLQQNCEFFRNAFRRGTKEGATGVVLSTPDWTVETIGAIVDLIVDGRCKIPGDYKELNAAASQIAIALRVCHPINGSNISDDETTVQLMAQRWTHRKSQFVLETRLLSSADAAKKWYDLFLAGMLVLQDEKFLVVEMGGQRKEDDHIKEPAANQQYLIGASVPLCVSVYHACFYLSGCQKGDGSAKHFDLDFPVNFGAGLYLKHALGISVKFMTCKQKELVTISGTIELLQKALDTVADFVIPSNDRKFCMLRVTNPNSVTLGRFISASQQCTEHPATLGWKVDDKSFYALKTISDIRIALAALASPSTTVAKKGPFHLREHSLSRGWVAF